MPTNIIHCEPEEARIGTDVEIGFEDLTQKGFRPKFKPLSYHQMEETNA